MCKSLNLRFLKRDGSNFVILNTNCCIKKKLPDSQQDNFILTNTLLYLITHQLHEFEFPNMYSKQMNTAKKAQFEFANHQNINLQNTLQGNLYSSKVKEIMHYVDYLGDGPQHIRQEQWHIMAQGANSISTAKKQEIDQQQIISSFSIRQDPASKDKQIIA